MLKNKLKFELARELQADKLILDTCPEPVQIMPPSESQVGKRLWENSLWEIPFWSLVTGNVMVGTILLLGLLSAPAWFSGLLQMIY